MMAHRILMPPTTVSSVTVKEEDWAPRLTAVGSVSAVQGAVVSAELAGVVSEINFENGGEAKKGEVLMKLDASQEEALLRSAEAEAQLAQTDLERSRDLAMKKVVSSAELDSAQSKFTATERSCRSDALQHREEDAYRAVRWPARNSAGERWAND